MNKNINCTYCNTYPLEHLKVEFGHTSQDTAVINRKTKCLEVSTFVYEKDGSFGTCDIEIPITFCPKCGREL